MVLGQKYSNNIMERHGNLGYIKITFIHQKTQLKWVKRQAVEWEKIFAIHGICTQKEVKDFNPEKSIKRWSKNVKKFEKALTQECQNGQWVLLIRTM